MSSETIADLIEAITTQPFGMPVRAMERLLAYGETAVPELCDAFDRWQDDEARDLLWLIVLLGELRHPSAIDALIRQMQQTEFDFLAVAAAEALAKIGKAALPALMQNAKSADPEIRLYSYVTVGWIDDDRSYTMLTEALSRDSELADIIANALADLGRAEALPQLCEAYKNSHPWQRLEFEEAINSLHWRRRPPTLLSDNWRLRYRPTPNWRYFNPGWPVIAVTLLRHPDQREQVTQAPLRSLEEITREPPKNNNAPDICENCGSQIELPTGLPVCPEIALGAALRQTQLLEKYREDGFDDLFDILDEINEQLDEAHEEPKAKSNARRERRLQRLDELALEQRTCHWLIEQGMENVGRAKAFLLSKAAWLADRDGDPNGLIQPASNPAVRTIKIGRNDPCACGSGRKYKRCCMAKTVL